MTSKCHWRLRVWLSASSRMMSALRGQRRQSRLFAISLPFGVQWAACGSSVRYRFRGDKSFSDRRISLSSVQCLVWLQTDNLPGAWLGGREAAEQKPHYGQFSK